MAWTTPVTWVDDAVIEAVDLNAQLRDNMAYCHSGKPAVAIARNNGSNYTPGASWANVDGTNLSISLSTTTGRALVMVSVQFAPAANSHCTLFLDVTVDGVRQGGTDGLACDISYEPLFGLAFTHLLTGLSTGSHTLTLQAKQTTNNASGAIVSSSAAFVHFSAMEV